VLFFSRKLVLEHIVIQNSVGEVGVGYIYAKNERFWNTIPACVLLRKNFQNGVPACSIRKLS
jgi:hypothetical protein